MHSGRGAAAGAKRISSEPGEEARDVRLVVEGRSDKKEIRQSGDIEAYITLVRRERASDFGKKGLNDACCQSRKGVQGTRQMRVACMDYETSSIQRADED